MFNTDMLIKCMADDFGKTNDQINQVIGIVSQDPQNMHFAWGVIQSIYNMLLPVGYALIALFFIMEFLKQNIDFANVSMEKTVTLVLRLVIAKLIMDNSFELLMGIFSMTSSMLAGINVQADMPQFDFETMRALIDTMGTWEKFLYGVRMNLFGMIMFFVKIIIDVIIYGRFIELFILTAFAPIPLSGIVSGELNQSTKRYLQEFTAVCLQGVVIVGVVMIYGGLVREFLAADWGIANMLASAILLVMMLMKSGSLARKLTGA